jgi:hypothetical protein
MTTHRQSLIAQMVDVNRVDRELAECWVQGFDDAEVESRLEIFAAQKRLLWARDLIRRAKEVPPGEQAELPLAKDPKDEKEVHMG